MIVGGDGTTVSQVGCTLLTLLRHPESVAGLDVGAVAVSDVVSETIRYEPSIGTIPRTLIEPVEIGGVERAADAMVFLSSASANRQSEAWGDPENVRPARFAQPGVAAGGPALLTGAFHQGPDA